MTLEGLKEPSILTKVRVVSTADSVGDSPVASCVQQETGNRLGVVAVDRIGVIAESVTFVDATRRTLVGCDKSGGPREGTRRWCGGSAGQLYGGRLRDPRLDIGSCTTARKVALGFVWVEPKAATRYVVVRQPGYAEVYETKADLPIRVATTEGLSTSPLSVAIEVSEHDAEGKLLRRYRLTAVPAS